MSEGWKRALLCVALVLIVAFWVWFVSTPWMERELSATVTMDIPGSPNQLVILEYNHFRTGEIEIYLRVPGGEDKLLGQGGTNEHCPITKGEYEVTFGAKTATLYYPYSSLGSSDRANWRELTVALEP